MSVFIHKYSGGELLGLLLHEGLNLSSVGRIRDEQWKLFSHFNLGKTELTVEGAPELRLEWLCCELVHFWSETNGGESSFGSKVIFIGSKVWSQALGSKNELSDRDLVL